MRIKTAVDKRFLIVYLLSLFSCNDCVDYNNRVYKPEELTGKVIDKYYDKKYKNMPRIVVNTLESKHVITPYGGDTTGIWQQVQTGDSIIKKEGTLTYVIISKGRTKKYTVDCSNTY